MHMDTEMVCMPLPTANTAATFVASQVRKKHRGGPRGAATACCDNDHSHAVVVVVNDNDGDEAPLLSKGSSKSACREEGRGGSAEGDGKDLWRLKVATGLAFFFMLVEIVGGTMAGSLAVLSDAFHLGLDVASYALALFAVHYSLRPGTKSHTYGYQRADVLGSLFSILSLWLLNAGLIYEAFVRTVKISRGDPGVDVDGRLMMIVALIGVAVNVVLLVVLGGNDVGGTHLHSHGGGAESHGHSHGGGTCDGGGGGTSTSLWAAYMHAFVDLLQSIGVLITGVVIWAKPSWQLADPIVTFVFTFLAFYTTVGVMKRVFKVLMEGVPDHVDVDDVRKRLEGLRVGLRVRDLHCWSISMSEVAMSGHAVLEDELSHAARRQLLRDAEAVCVEEGIGHVTLQIESLVCGDGVPSCNHNPPCTLHSRSCAALSRCYKPS